MKVRVVLLAVSVLAAQGGLAARERPQAGQASSAQSPAVPAPGAASPSPTPAAPAPEAEPAASQSTSAATPSTRVVTDPAKMQPGDARRLLYKVYTEAYQFSDVAAKLHPESWKLPSRKYWNIVGQSRILRASLDSLKPAWDRAFANPEDVPSGRATDAGVHRLRDDIETLNKLLEGTPGASQAAEYAKTASDLAEDEHTLDAYLDYHEGKSNPGATAQANAPTAAAAATTPPAAPAPSETSPTAPSQPAASSAASSAQPSNPAPAPPAPESAAPEPAAATPRPEITGAPSTPTAPAATTRAQPAPAPAQPATQPAAAPANPTSAPATPSASVEAPASAAPSAPAPAPVALSVNEAQALLYKIYVAGFRTADLAGAIPFDQMKVSDTQQATIAPKAEAVRKSEFAMEKTRSEFYNAASDAGLAQKLRTSLEALLPEIGGLADSLAAVPATAPLASDFRQSDSDLSKLDGQLEAYVAYLTSRELPTTAASLAASAATSGGGLVTEIVQPSAAPPPLTTTFSEKSPLNTDELKAILFKAYAPAFRLKDLLDQEQPAKWKATDEARGAFAAASQTLSASIANLEKWRAQFAEHPQSLEAGFEVYAALGKLTEPAATVGHLVGKYENAGIGSEYLERAQQVGSLRDQVEPYLEYMLGAFDHQGGMLERNFRACESQLTTARRSDRPVATPMRNINPVFKGHPKVRAKKPAADKKTAPQTKKP